MRLKEISSYLKEQGIEFDLTGDSEQEIRGYAALNEYTPGTITWVRGNGKGFEELDIDFAVTEKQCVIPIKNRIVCDKPKEVFFMIMDHYFNNNRTYHNSRANIFGNVQLGKDVVVGDGSILDGDIIVGDETIIGYGVKLIGNVIIGSNCVIKSGVVIGEEDIDFYFTDDGQRHIKKQFGGVVIGDNVIIGPNTVINRGALGNTTIGDNVIIDDRCNISHNVRIGKNTAIITGTSLFGSSEVGERCYISTSFVKNQVKIGDNVTVGLGSVVLKNLPSNTLAYGSPAIIIDSKNNKNTK